MVVHIYKWTQLDISIARETNYLSVSEKMLDSPQKNGEMSMASKDEKPIFSLESLKVPAKSKKPSSSSSA